MKTRNTHILATAFLLSLGFRATLMAQTTPPPAPTETADETYKLGTFTVNVEKDFGYTAVDSLAGGRQAAPVRVTPGAISSLTTEFIRDTGVTDVADALKWAVNVVPNDPRGGMNGGTGGEVFGFFQTSVRGDSISANPPMKDYFPYYLNIDAYDIDRIEVDGGPNSILFGLGNLGGQISTYRKQADLAKSNNELKLSYDSWGGYRATIDTNQQVGHKAALRLNVVSTDAKGWIDGDHDKKLGLDLGGTFKLTNTTTLRANVEGFKEKKTMYTANFQDGTSVWNKTTVNTATNYANANIANSGANPLTTPGAPGVTTTGAWGAHEYVTSGSISGVYDWIGSYRSMGTNDFTWGAYMRPSSFTYAGTSVVVPALPNRHFAIAPKDANLNMKENDGTISLEQKINENSEVIATGYYYDDSAYAINFEGAGNGNSQGAVYDLNQYLPNGSANPNFKKEYSEYFLDKQTQNHTANEIRAQYSYHFDSTLAGVPWKQLLSLAASNQLYELKTHQYIATADTNDIFGSMIWGRIYWDNPSASLNVPATVNGKAVTYAPLGFNWYDNYIARRTNSLSAFSQSRFWNDRLAISLGGREDDIKFKYASTRGDANAYESTTKHYTYSAGGVYYLGGGFGIESNYATNNVPPSEGTVWGTVMGGGVAPAKGDSFDFGLRYAPEDGKDSVSLRFYQDKAVGMTTSVNDPGFQNIWNDYFLAGGTATDIGPAGNVTVSSGVNHANMHYNGTADYKHSGVELSASLNPTKNIRIALALGMPKATIENFGKDNITYYNAHLSEWTTIAAGSSAKAQTLATDLANAKQTVATLASQPSQTEPGVSKYTASAFVTYQFTEGSLKGLEIGAGEALQGKRFVGYQNGTAIQTYQPSYATTSAMLAYGDRYVVADMRLQVRFQLNVENLLGNKDLIFTSYGYNSYNNGGLQSMDYYQVAPRKVTLSATLTF